MINLWIMRKLILIILSLISTSLTFADNKALLVGIGNYPQNSGWHTISSVNDVKLLCNALPKNYAIRTLVDSEATYDRIKKSLAVLNKQCSVGDTIFLHFSCHGQQVINEGCNEVDSLDEALVPYDALSKKSEDYDGSKHLLDDELGQYLTRLRTSVGPKGLLIVTLDACFSDSMNKGKRKNSGTVVYRGGEEIFGSNYITKERLADIQNHRRFIDNSILITSDTLSDIIIISACKSYQKNMEVRIDGKGYGSLSYSIWQTFKDTGFSTIDSWIDDVLMHMSENAFIQNPQVRTTLNYKKESRNEIKDTQSASVEKTNKTSYMFYIVSVVVVIIIFILWKTKRK